MKTPTQNHKDVQLAAFAEYLRATRLQQGATLHRTAKALSIDKEQLVALETWDESSLPPESYRVGLLNAYAQVLGVDPIKPRRKAVRPVAYGSPTGRRRVLSRWLVGGAGVAVGLLLLTYVSWLSQSLLSKPKLIVYEPVNDLVQAPEYITVSGKTGRQTLVRIDGQPVAVADDGYFSYGLYLRSGQNTITVTAINSLGRQSTVTRAVYR